MAKNSRLPGSPGVLVPRPYRAEDTLVMRLRAAGAEVYALPVVVLEPLPRQGASLGQVLAAADIIIFVSAHGVDFCLRQLAEEGGELPRGPRYMAVGRTTAQRLEATGRHVVFPSRQANSEGLLALPELAAVVGKRILICRGRGGRDALRRELVRRGAQVSYVDLYERRACAGHCEEIRSLVSDGHIQAVMVHSGDVLDGLLGCFGGELPARDLVYVVPGDRVAALVAEQGAGRVAVAASALAENMVEAWVRWYTEHTLR